MDDNHATDRGWQALALVLQTTNKTVQHMGFPWKDFHRRITYSRRVGGGELRKSAWAKFHLEAQKVMQQLYIHRCQMSEPFRSSLDKEQFF